MLWEDLTKYDAEGKATSGKIRLTVSQVDPIAYEVRLAAGSYDMSKTEAKRVTVSGIASGNFEMHNGLPPASFEWIGVRYDTDTDSIEVIDESYDY